jgi:hypothetical protein
MRRPSPFHLIVAGALATVAFDAFGQGLSPLLGLPSLAPVPLANQVIGTLFGAGSPPLAVLVHYATGLLAYPLGWALLAAPAGARLGLPWPVTAIAYGIVLWVFALWVMASLIAGNPPFLGFGGLTWVALVGHVLFALVAGWALRRKA